MSKPGPNLYKIRNFLKVKCDRFRITGGRNGGQTRHMGRPKFLKKLGKLANTDTVEYISQNQEEAILRFFVNEFCRIMEIKKGVLTIKP